jgi:hypothetical protein
MNSKAMNLFYGAYNIYSGPHQRCWVHLLRDLEQLREEQQNDGERLAWVLAPFSVPIGSASSTGWKRQLTL